MVQFLFLLNQNYTWRNGMNNKYRLSASVYERETEDKKVEPPKIYFLSVEGNITEKEYFAGISANRKRLGINGKVDVEVLRRSRKDTNSAPQQVKIPRKQRNSFVTELMKIGYDINYRKYLQRYNNDMDEFAILIDRDMQTHSEINMRDCIAYCKEKKYRIGRIMEKAVLILGLITCRMLNLQ